jgi:hypothetical protein
VKCLLAIVAALTFAACAFAHDVSTSYSRIRVDGSRVHVQFMIGLFDFHKGPNLDQDGDTRISRQELDGGIHALVDAVTSHFQVSAPDAPSSITLEKYDFQGEGAVRIDLLYKFAHDVTTLNVTSTLPEITQPDHQHLLALGDGDDTRQGVLNMKTPSVQVDLKNQSSFEVFWSFLKLGIEHIVTGYDHLAFLAGLLIATTTLFSLVKIVTSFTVAHSITLALATFNLVNLPSRVVESLIALTIAYVAIENFTGKTLVHRWKITFLFGLVHGFGFSNVLKEMELTRRHLAISLFSFNAGVEVGQLFFIGIVFPVVVLTLKTKWKDQFLVATSLAIMCLGFYWFLQRAFLT